MAKQAPLFHSHPPLFPWTAVGCDDLKTDAELRAGSGAGTWSPGSSRCGAAWGCLGEARRVPGSVQATVRRGCCGALRCCGSCWIYSCQVTIATGAHLHFLFDLSNRASTCPAPCCHSRFLSIFLLQIPPLSCLASSAQSFLERTSLSGQRDWLAPPFLPQSSSLGFFPLNLSRFLVLSDLLPIP